MEPEIQNPGTACRPAIIKIILLWNLFAMIFLLIALVYVIWMAPTWAPSRVRELDRSGTIKKDILREKFPDLAENYPHDLGMWIAQKERKTAIFLSTIGIIVALVDAVLVWVFLDRKNHSQKENDPHPSILFKGIIAWNLIALVILSICWCYASWMASMGGPFRITELDRALVINETKLREDFPRLAENLRRDLGIWIAQKERRVAISLAKADVFIPFINLFLALAALFKKQHILHILLTMGAAILLYSWWFFFHNVRRPPDFLDLYQFISYLLFVLLVTALCYGEFSRKYL